MEDFVLYFFKDMPEVIKFYYRYRLLFIKSVLLGAITIALLTKADRVRSLSLGIAIGIILVSIGESVSRLRSNGSKKLRTESGESVNG